MGIMRRRFGDDPVAACERLLRSRDSLSQTADWLFCDFRSSIVVGTFEVGACC